MSEDDRITVIRERVDRVYGQGAFRPKRASIGVIERDGVWVSDSGCGCAAGAALIGQPVGGNPNTAYSESLGITTGELLSLETGFDAKCTDRIWSSSPWFALGVELRKRWLEPSA